MMPVAVVTGGSSGIGRATAEALAAAGYRVYELSRSGSDFSGVRHITADLRDAESVRRAFHVVSEEAGALHLLVNNAGCGVSGAVETTSAAQLHKQFDVNVMGLVFCVQAAMPLLRESRGRIINISSVAAVFSIPFQSFYSAAKAAVNQITLALRTELRPFSVSVCALMPGDVRTGFTNAREKAPENPLYGGAEAKAVAVMERDEQGGMPPEKLARRIVQLAKKRRVRPFYTLGVKYHVFLALGKVLPAGVANWVVSLMYR